MYRIATAVRLEKSVVNSSVVEAAAAAAQKKRRVEMWVLQALACGALNPWEWGENDLHGSVKAHRTSVIR